MFSKKKITIYTENYLEQIEKIKNLIEQSDAIIIGAGAGFSSAAGFTYSGERFKQHFSDFETKYGFQDMYSGGFYPYKTLEEYWAYWSKFIYLNRFQDAPKPLYETLLKIIKNKNYFVITTNVDHCFQKAGVNKERLFYTQGDYGLFQCSTPCHQKTYDNEDIVKQMVKNQNNMQIKSELIPYCPVCGKPMTMNLRSDNTFVEDDGWHAASIRYNEFLNRHKDEKVLFLELGVGYNTPGIIKYPFIKMTYENSNAKYICINNDKAVIPKEIEHKSIYVNKDASIVLESLLKIFFS